jgi:hypothetical protein
VPRYPSPRGRPARRRAAALVEHLVLLPLLLAILLPFAFTAFRLVDSAGLVATAARDCARSAAQVTVREDPQETGAMAARATLVGTWLDPARLTVAVTLPGERLVPGGLLGCRVAYALRADDVVGRLPAAALGTLSGDAYERLDRARDRLAPGGP